MEIANQENNKNYVSENEVEYDSFHEINKTGFCVLEVEDYYASSAVVYLINLKDKKIVKKEVLLGCEEYDIISEVTTSDIEELLNQFPDFEVADVDGDYFFKTDYLLVRFQDCVNE